MFRQVSTVVLVLVAVGSLTVVAAEERKEVGSTTKSLPKELTIDLGKGVKLEMVLIPAGEFLMGSPDSDKDARDSEKPQHRVRITKPFYFGKYPVTQEQWEAVMGNHRSLFKGPKNPVETVGWDDCQQFLAKLNSKSSTQGGKFQLPSEAQWEYACRAGSTTKYYFGDDANRLEDYVHSGRGTYPVGEKKPNAWGLYDMCGNVFEWCQDWYHAGYYVKSPPDDPTGPETRTRPSPVAIFPKDKPTDRTVAPYTFYPMGTDHVIRGCGDMGNGTDYRSAVRSHSGGGFGFLGLRVALIPADKVSTAAEPTPAPPQPITNSIGMKLTLVPSGEFMMGSKESAEETAAFFKKTYGEETQTADNFKNEHPQHPVRITRPFYLGTYHVTRGQFRQFVTKTGYKTDAEKGDKPGAVSWNQDTKQFDYNEKYSWRNVGFEQGDEHPAVIVSWDDAVAFCEWLSTKEGKSYRLPTEAEWEYACRAGTKTRYYSGDDPETLAKVGNVADATFSTEFPHIKEGFIKASDGYVFTAPVGSYKPNAFGLYDMHGNAWQWCSDRYAAEYYATSPTNDPAGPDFGPKRVCRGSAWYCSPEFARSANRSRNFPSYRFYGDVGFRVARTQ